MKAIPENFSDLNHYYSRQRRDANDAKMLEESTNHTPIYDTLPCFTRT